MATLLLKLAAYTTAAAVVLRLAECTCTGLGGVEVREGTAWVADDGCNSCTCYPSEVHCKSWRNCADGTNEPLGFPGDPVCVYALSGEYKVGDTWTTRDGCNTCVCTPFGMNCTYHACSNSGFANPKYAGQVPMEFGDCPYNGAVYEYGDHFLAADGCNTCVCDLPGNVATFAVCTTTPCALVG